MSPGIYPPGVINPPPGWKGESLPTITIHGDGTPEYSTEESNDKSTPQTTKPSATSLTSKASSSTSGSSASVTSSSASSSTSSFPVESFSEFPYSSNPTLAPSAMIALGSWADAQWSSELKGLGFFAMTNSMSFSSMTTHSSISSTASQSAIPSPPPPFPSPSCLPAAEGGFDVGKATDAIGSFCTGFNQVVGPGASPASQTFPDGHNLAGIRLTLSWDDIGNCPANQNPTQNDGRDCNTIFHNIINGCRFALHSLHQLLLPDGQYVLTITCSQVPTTPRNRTEGPSRGTAAIGTWASIRDSLM